MRAVTSSLAHFKPDFSPVRTHFASGGALRSAAPWTSSSSGVGNHARDLFVVTVRHNHAFSELSLGLWRFRRQDVPRLRVAPLDLAGAGLRKTLGRARMGLQLWHYFLFFGFEGAFGSFQRLKAKISLPLKLYQYT
jgi:hypothetical protein